MNELKLYQLLAELSHFAGWKMGRNGKMRQHPGQGQSHSKMRLLPQGLWAGGAQYPDLTAWRSFPQWSEYKWSWFPALLIPEEEMSEATLLSPCIPGFWIMRLNGSIAWSNSNEVRAKESVKAASWSSCVCKTPGHLSPLRCTAVGISQECLFLSHYNDREHLKVRWLNIKLLYAMLGINWSRFLLFCLKCLPVCSEWSVFLSVLSHSLSLSLEHRLNMVSRWSGTEGHHGKGRAV